MIPGLASRSPRFCLPNLFLLHPLPKTGFWVFFNTGKPRGEIGTEMTRTLSPNQERGKSGDEVEPGGEEGSPKTKRPIVHGGEGGP